MQPLMKVLSKVFVLSVSVLFLLANQTWGQFNAEGSDQKRLTKYTKSDTIYIYNQITSVRHGVFTARSPWGGNASFTWSRYDSTIHSFQLLPKTDINVLSSKLDTTLGGGYKVYINNGSGKDTSIIFWFYPHKISLLVLKNSDGYVPYYKYTCNYVTLDATAKTDTFKYFDPLTNKKYVLANSILYNWTADNSEAGTLLPKASFRNYDPPTKNTTFTCSVTDSFKYGPISDKVNFIAVRVIAKFDTLSEAPYFEHKSAPFKVKFINKSENGLIYSWYWGDGDTLAPIYVADTLTHPYKTSGTFVVRLVVERKDCIDSTKKEITVDPAYMEGNDKSSSTTTEGSGFPNIYVTGVGKNFLPANASVKEYSFTIFSRWGNVVYETKGVNMEDWKGWDGTYKNSIVSEGVYYYILIAKPFNKTTATFPEVYKGFFYVYHSK
jgi:hypothetical protein